MTAGSRAGEQRAARGVARLCIVLLALVVPARAQDGESQTGIASYYAHDFHGKTTANGERFSMWAMTAAHQALPFNTLVRVTNLDNRKQVVVRINDAGPFKDDRIIDLSKAAAARLDMIRSGKARVRLDIVGQAPSINGDHVSRNDFYKIDISRARLSGYGIQVASFTDLDHLIVRLNALERKGVGNLYVQIGTVDDQTVHRLVIGGFDDRPGAEAALRTLKKKGVPGFVFQVR
jgi:rare lipoprotein A